MDGSPINEDAEVKITLGIEFFLHTSSKLSKPIMFTCALVIEPSNEDTKE